MIKTFSSHIPDLFAPQGKIVDERRGEGNKSKPLGKVHGHWDRGLFVTWLDTKETEGRPLPVTFICLCFLIWIRVQCSTISMTLPKVCGLS